MWHHPRYSSSHVETRPRCSRSSTRCYAAHADLVLVGHDHIYERFALLGPNGALDPNGMRHFTVGTGGSSHHSVGTDPRRQRDPQRLHLRRAAARAAPGELRLGVPPRSPASRFTDSGTQAIVGGNAPPSATVALTPTTAGTNDVLTATATKSDPETDPVSLTWEWRVNGVLRRTFTSGSALTDTFDLSAAGNGDAGDTVAVTVTPSDAAHAGTPVSASLVDQRDEPGAGVHDRPDRPDPGRGRQRLARRRTRPTPRATP